VLLLFLIRRAAKLRQSIAHSCRRLRHLGAKVVSPERMHKRAHTCMYARVCACVCVSVCVSVRVCVQVCVCASLFMYPLGCTYVCLCKSVCVHACLCMLSGCVCIYEIRLVTDATYHLCTDPNTLIDTQADAFV